ncbi:Fic family protein [Anaerobium acetethylicum]|uniref:Fic family protein n=1 Tax=Anaerobium acetethylicum TaxID=1619234 RepID=A0A1D3TZC7_9FIRM|nr:Fic family protein [Anaerobium acetethylicum]SCP99901.1 Fic family protein [Anaerobium acetethylicum]
MKKRPFVPNQLPMPELLDMQRLMFPLMNAGTKIAVYNEKLKSTKINHTNLLELFSLKEAVESTKIEGTQVTMDEMLNYRAVEKKATNDILEVINYMKALREGTNLLARYPISSNLIKKLHQVLMQGDARGSSSVAEGEFRTIQNFLGPKGATIENATYIPPEPQLVPEYMSNLEKYINNNEDDLPLIKVALLHSQFETIHPFTDGNGRTGRILVPLYLFSEKVIDEPNFLVSESLEKDKYKYYALLNSTRVVIPDKEYYPKEYELKKKEAKKSMTEWVEFFLNACVIQADKNINKIDSVNMLYDATIAKAKNISNTTTIIDVIDIIFMYPIFTTANIREHIEISVSTLNNYLNKLCESNIIYSNGAARNRKYYFYDLISIIN